MTARSGVVLPCLRPRPEHDEKGSYSNQNHEKGEMKTQKFAKYETLCGMPCLAYRLPLGVKYPDHRRFPRLAKYVRVGGWVFEYPDFIKSHGNRNDSQDLRKHSFWFPRQGLLRLLLSESACFHIHQLIEMPLVKLRHNYFKSKRCLPMKRPFYQIIGFFLGLNCGFGMKDCILYTYWMLKYGGRPIAVKPLESFLEKMIE